MTEYRRRPGPRNLQRVANGIMDLYAHLRPKLNKIKKGKEYEKKLKPLDDYLMGLPEELEPSEWAAYFKVCLDAIESLGVTKITLPQGREGAEMLEGTLH